MSVYGWIWFAIFGIASPLVLVTASLLSGSGFGLLWLFLIPALYVFARSVFSYV